MIWRIGTIWAARGEVPRLPVLLIAALLGAAPLAGLAHQHHAPLAAAEDAACREVRAAEGECPTGGHPHDPAQSDECPVCRYVVQKSFLIASPPPPRCDDAATWRRPPRDVAREISFTAVYLGRGPPPPATSL